jgi:RNA polymerase sigma-70 factor (ECF subfamily)
VPDSTSAPRRAIVYCIVPEELAAELHDSLRRHFAGDPGVIVVVEQRWRDRRRDGDRRNETAAERDDDERRHIRGERGRRVADRRLLAARVPPPAGLPSAAEKLAEDLIFVERLEPSSEKLEDHDTGRLVARFQAGDRDVFSELYLRYFDRVYTYLRMLYKESHEAEDATQQVFMKVFENIHRYERRRQPFRAWLFTIVRNYAVSDLRKTGRMTPVQPDVLERQRDEPVAGDVDIKSLTWLSDHDLLLFIERLPIPQRQVLMLRYMLDLSTAEIGEVLGRGQDDVRQLHSRALQFLRQRLAAVGRTSPRSDPMPMRRAPSPRSVLRSRRFALLNL